MPPITDLDDLIRHLSGREADGRTKPPSGDATSVLDEIRRRTRALLDDDPDDQPRDPWDDRDAPPRSLSPRPQPRRLLFALALVLLGAALALAADRAWRLLDRPPSARTDPAIAQALARIEAQLAAPMPPQPGPPAPDPAVGALAQSLDARFAALAARLDRLDHRPDRAEVAPVEPDAPRAAPPADPALARLVAELAAIRREQASGEAATSGHIQEMRSLLQQVNTEVRRVLNRPESVSSTTLAPLMSLAVQALAHNLQHPSAQVRGEAVEQLARLSPTSRTAIPALRDRFARETDPNVRNAIETTLSILTNP